MKSRNLITQLNFFMTKSMEETTSGFFRTAILQKLDTPEDFEKDAIIEKQVRPVGYGYMENYVNDRVLFVGDAAFQCNPLTNGGIGPGMIAGKTAAKSIVEGNPISYDTAWKRMIFSSQVFVDAYQSLSLLTNQEMQDLIKPLNSNPAVLFLPRVLLFHRKYMKIYKAFKLSQKVGW